MIRKNRNSKTCGESDLSRQHSLKVMRADSAADPFSHISSFRSAGFWHQHNEFVASITRHFIFFSSCLENNFSDLHRSFCSDQMTVTVIDRFEPIQIQENDAETFPAIPSLFDHSSKSGMNVPGIVKLCQIIRNCKLFRLLKQKSIVQGYGYRTQQHSQSGKISTGKTVTVRLSVNQFDHTNQLTAANQGNAQNRPCLEIAGLIKTGIKPAILRNIVHDDRLTV